MLNRRQFLLSSGGIVAVGWVAGHMPSLFAANTAPATMPDVEKFDITHTERQWREQLTAGQYFILREAGTEIPYSSPLNNEHRQGIFFCAGCDLPVFSSLTKFDSHTGWPSFWQPLEKAVVKRRDITFGVVRQEVHCRRCGGHLGHVFDDGPPPTGLRYCMNGAAMLFRPDKL
ncbi:hypothetical protein ED28_00150 [[Pantoea] beijingensis]|uniref:peptide-methionine (R)-S-oxide reductase n=1 Tax=[Pantoea] beijingensis TaxID=1324864 RepID=A0A443IHC9_9GAMM|nr:MULTISPECIES: peptide-methionine (R)-S-oxide reductase MsrB [Erwiniaceae]RWR03433.1 hypothetical protein ED28_00150 [[Pantoea] beijingensis]